MIDLRKPLEGVPGLLLMAALILFGATIGIAIALGFTWIPMSDALANFLGGVVGAGLGAALAVTGAVYVQRRDRQFYLFGLASSLDHELSEIEMFLRITLQELGHPTHTRNHAARGLVIMRRWLWPYLRRLERLHFEHQLGPRVSEQVERLRTVGRNTQRDIRLVLKRKPNKDYGLAFASVSFAIEMALRPIGELRSRLAPLCREGQPL